MTYALIERASGSVALLRIQAEGREREALDEHLHREIGHVPATVGERIVEE